MHRRNLTLRRFGALSFGLGYYEDGVWIDHSVTSEGSLGVIDDVPADAGRVDPAAVHQWYSCCGDALGEITVVPEALDREMAQMLRVAGRSAP